MCLVDVCLFSFLVEVVLFINVFCIIISLCSGLFSSLPRHGILESEGIEAMKKFAAPMAQVFMVMSIKTGVTG